MSVVGSPSTAIRSASIPAFHRADLHMQHPAGNRGRGFERVNRRHSVVDHQLDFLGVQAVVEDADVAAAQNGHAGVERHFEAGALALDSGRLGAFPFQPEYMAVEYPAARVGHSATWCSAIILKTSGVP